MKDTVLTSRVFTTVAVVVSLAGLFAVIGPAVCSSEADDTQQTQATEDYYQSRITELQKRAEAAVREVNEGQLGEREKAEAIKKNRYLEELGYVPSGKLLSDEEVNAIEKQRAQSEKAVRARVESEVKRIEEQKARDLAARTAGAGRGAEARPRPPASAPGPGTVTGIVFCEDKGAALVFGDIVHESDVIHGAKVAKIVPDCVEFEKQGNRWKQQVGQSPAAFWQQEPPATQQAPATQRPPSVQKPAATK